MSPTIRISQSTYDHLKQHAEPFIDTPDSVIRRLVGLDTHISEGVDDGSAETPAEEARVRRANKVGPSQETVAPAGTAQGRSGRGAASDRSRGRRNSAKRPARAPRGSLLAEEAYEIPMLQALAERGGRARKNEVLDALESRLADQLTKLDRTPIASGEIRWRNRAQFARLRLMERGEIKRNSPRGIWELSEAGDARLRELGSSIAVA